MSKEQLLLLSYPYSTQSRKKHNSTNR
nr:unnamed protein product [Callosobruchus chinensis]